MSTRTSAEGVSERLDVALSMVDDLQRQVDVLTRAVLAVTESMVVIEDAHKLTDAHPFASGRHDAEIAHYAGEGWTDKAIAELLGTSPATVSRRRAALGIEPNNPRRRWGRSDDDLLRAMAARFDTWEQVARRIPGRTPAACQRRACQIGVTIRAPWAPWSRESLDYLRDEWEKGTPIDEIATNVGRSFGACREKARQLGLTQSRKRLQIVSARESTRFWQSHREPR